MGFIFSSKKRERIVAIFDIGSGSVGGAMVKIPANNQGVPEIIKTVASNEIKFRKDLDFNLLLRDMSSALFLTASSLNDQKLGAPDEIYCFIASPWYLSETRTIKMNRDKAFIFNKRLADELIQKEITNLKEIYKSKYEESEGVPEIIERQIMSVLLNGYSIEEPLGKRCKSLEMNMIISIAPLVCLNKIRDTLSKTFHNTKINFSSFTVASYLAIRDKYVTQDSYLLIDVSGEITDVGIVSKGALKAVLSFPFGKKTLLKQLCSKLDIELRDAKELFKLYSEGNLSANYAKKVTPIFKSIENSWNDSFKQCVSTLPRTLVLPNTIFLTVDNDIKKWFTRILQDEEYIQSAETNNKRNVVSIDGPEFLPLCSSKEGICDPFIMIESIAIMRKLGK